MSYVIEQFDDGLPVYWSLKQTVHPAGHWGERGSAICFARPKDAQDFINMHLRHQAERCRIIPHDFGY